MTTRQYSSRSQQSTLTAAITSGATSMTVVSGTALLGGVTIPSGRTFTLVIDPDTAIEEIVDATAVSTNTFTITRAIDGSTAQDHSAGAAVRHMAIGRDYRDANLHAEADASYNDGGGNAHSLHGIASGEGVVVGTLKTQTLTNKTLTSPTISDPTITGTASAGAVLVFEGTTADAYETTLTVVDPTQDNTVTIPNTTGTVVLDSATQTLTNKTLTSPTISGSPVITGLSSAGMVDSSATPKNYVDSILGSATAAATSAASAATSASSAATSASSASASASSASTSASSAATSATAAATSASSAATSATAAATSATSAAASATAATTSATSAETSATAAATSASSASTSASSALTSANSASTSASSAATSASSASTSASSAATSASSAAASYDQFDDRYLGSKTSDPTVDNDGNPLITGALYFNSVIGAMKVYDGAAWDLVAPDTSNFIDKSILSGKGALISASGASTPVALTAPSTNGWILSGDSATTSGLAWVAPSTADITGVTAGDGISGGGTSGDVSIAVDSTVLRTTGGQVISANTSANAFEIRQTGTGNAFVVEDETNPDSTPFVIAADGRVGIGTTSPDALLNIYSATGGGITVSSDAGANNIISRSSDDTTQPNLVLRKSRGTTASKTIVQDGDLLANIGFQGYDGSVSRNGAQITSTVDGAPSLGVIPARIAFATTDTAGNGAERLRINGSGAISVNSTSSTLGAGTVAHQIGTVSSSAANVVEVIRGAASQTGNLTEWQNSSGTILARVNSSGQFVGDGSQLTGITTPGGTFKIASGSAGGEKTYTISLPAGGYVVNAFNSLGFNKGVASIATTFGATTYRNFLWSSSQNLLMPSVPLVIQTTSTLSSIVIDTAPSAGWTSVLRSGGFGTTQPSISEAAFSFGASIFVIGGEIGSSTTRKSYIATSTDGLTWTSRTPTGFGNTTIAGIRFGSGIFVGIDYAGNISTSTNGTTWTSRANGMSSGSGRGVIANIPNISNPWLAALTGDANGTYVSSTDGVTWTTRANPIADVSKKVYSIAGSNNFATAKVVMMLSGGLSTYLTSTDGVTWTTRAFPTSSTNQEMSIETDGSKYVFAYNDIYSSTDGITWTLVTSGSDTATFPTGGSVTTPIYNATPTAKWVARGGKGVVSSTDGVTWYTHGLDSLKDMSGTPCTPQYGNGKWVIVPAGNPTSYPQVYTSTDGIGTTYGDIIGSIVSAGTVTTL